MEMENKKNIKRDYDKEPIVLNDYNSLLMWWQTIFIIIPFGTILVLINPFEVNLSEAISRVMLMIPIATFPIYKRYRNIRGHRKILLKNKTIYYYHDDYEITKINLESIETIYKTFDDFYHISQRLSLFYNILMILFFPFIILNKFDLLLIKSFIHIKKCGFNKYPLYDAIIIREINNEVITILPLCQNERDEIKKYFMSKLNIDIDKLDTHISFLYSLENINTGER
jgi:hypothetical protein